MLGTNWWQFVVQPVSPVLDRWRPRSRSRKQGASAEVQERLLGKRNHVVATMMHGLYRILPPKLQNILAGQLTNSAIKTSLEKVSLLIGSLPSQEPTRASHCLERQERCALAVGSESV